MYRSWNISTAVGGYLIHADYNACPSCDSRLCPQTSLACVQERCRPVNSGYVELGRKSLAKNCTTRIAGGFRQCAQRCSASECSGFALDAPDCLLYNCDLLSVGAGSYESYLKQSCGSFTCPASSYLADSPKSGDVNPASCCTCSSPNMVGRMEGPEFRCVTCPAGHAPDVSQVTCVACAHRTYAALGASACQACPKGLKAVPNRTHCERCPAGMFASKLDTCETCSFPLVLYDDGCIWWHMPLIVVGCVLLAVCVRTLAGAWAQHKKTKGTEREATFGAFGFWGYCTVDSLG